MKAVYLVLLLVAVTAALDLDQQLERDEIIDAVNSGHSTWTAGRNFNPSITKKYIKHLLGTFRRPEGSRLPALVDDGLEIDLPKNFDAREKWSKCISLQEVRDQGPCGSCWAVGAAAAFTDRYCIASKMAFNGHLSAEELLSCCYECGDGCNGGFPDTAWGYFESNGIVTGGDYHSHEGCQPYTLPTCEHHVPGKRKNCKAYGNLPTPPCKSKCYNKKYKDHSFIKDHHKVKSTFSISNNVKQTQKEIFNNGPLEASFTVYEDFLSYKSGVYQHTSGGYLGGHAVKVIGWGVEKNVPYWLVANSWNSDWGDHGFFKIKRGNDECGFEDDMSGGYPDIYHIPPINIFYIPSTHLLGTFIRPEGSRLPALVDDGLEIDLPKNFDAREKWSKCISLQEVRDQGPCGSCWAVAAAAVFTDRYCIASNMAFNGHLSAEELLCCTSCGSGCGGGWPDFAWQYFESDGIVTGGDYHSHEGCQPYTLPACEHHVLGKRKNCSAYGDLPTPPCKSKCYNKKYKDHSFADDHHKVKSTFSISHDVGKTQKEIFKNGPVEATFTVYEDFLSYKSGVYQHMTGGFLAGHAVKVIGWGVEKNVPYWLVANSWNSDWGDHGFFKIKRGSNECGFEGDMSGGYPDV